ncbi:MAG: Rossman fold protein, TIGR00730 family [Bacteroidales bacterium 45-6]|nr:MAG: Rossman fold protein, TIGR00730 family [Bacteroidales bacterium 45-6]
MAQVSSICVYCASSTKIDQAYVDTAKELGVLLAEKNIACINGAGKMGLMGAVSDATLQNKGRVVGVIPRFMVDNGWFHVSLSELHVTETMHERKQKMAELADGCIALPGGIGTLEELIEVITWKQLGLYNKPIVILNTKNYYDLLLQLLKRMADEKFMRPMHTELWAVAQTPAEAIRLIEEAEAWPDNYGKFAAL